MEFRALDTQYYKITGHLHKKKSYVQKEDVYEYKNNLCETNFYDIRSVHKFINCGISIWKVNMPKDAKYIIKDGIGKSNHIVLSDCEDIDDFVVEHSLYEATCHKKSLLKKFGPIESIKVNDNILVAYPSMVKNILQPNIQNATEYIQTCTPSEIYECALIKAINANPHVLEHIKKPSKPLITLALLKDGTCLRYVKNQSPELCMIAINTTSWAFQYVTTFTLELCYKALDGDIDNYKYIPKRYKKECTLYRDKLLLKEQEKLNAIKKEKEDDDKRHKSMMSLCAYGAQDIYLMSGR